MSVYIARAFVGYCIHDSFEHFITLIQKYSFESIEQNAKESRCKRRRHDDYQRINHDESSTTKLSTIKRDSNRKKGKAVHKHSKVMEKKNEAIHKTILFCGKVVKSLIEKNKNHSKIQPSLAAMVSSFCFKATKTKIH